MVEKRLVKMLALAMVAGLMPAAAFSHYHVFWPQQEGCYGQPGEAVIWRYFWGHPFEMLISEAPSPRFFIKTPNGRRDPVVVKAISLRDQERGQDRKAYEITYTPQQPGDYYLCLEGQPEFIPEEKLFRQDYVKEVWHVREERGWDKPVGMEFEIIPMTRPYGWPGGSLFKGQVRFMGKPLKGALVEVEKLSGFYLPKDKFPKDRCGEDNLPMITRVTKTDVQGYLCCTLDSPGWWLISVAHLHGKKTLGGKTYPIERRAGLWLYLEPPPPPVQ